MTKSRDLGDLAQTVAVNLPTALGTAGQTLVVNSGADGLEFGAASGGGGMTVYNDLNGTDGTPSGYTYLTNASSPSNGDLAFVTANNTVYVRAASGWRKIATVQEAPSTVTGHSASYPDIGQNPTTDITLSTTDPEGFDVTWSYVVGGNGTLSGSNINNSNGDTLASIAVQTANSNSGGTNTITYRITRETTSIAGDFTITFTATDSQSTGTSDTGAISFEIAFVIADSHYTTLLMATDGSAGNNQDDISDSSSSNHTITVNGDAHAGTFSPYRHGGYSTYFDGNDYLSIAHSTDLDLGTGNFTIEGWWRFDDTSNQNLVSKYAGNAGFVVQYQSGNLRLVLGLGSSDAVYSFSWTPVAGTWYHVCILRDGTNGKAFINGTQIGSTTTVTTSNVGTTGTLQIGLTHTVSEYTRGYVSDVRIVKGTAITPASGGPTERLITVSGTGYSTSLLTCHLPYITDGSSNTHSITVNGDPETKPFGPYDYQEYSASDNGGSVYFDGTGDVIYTPQDTAFNFGTGDFTFEAWVYPTLYTSNNWNTLFAIGNSTNFGGLLVGKSDTGSFVIRQYGTANVVTTTNLPDLNAWTHIACVRSSGTSKLYYNGSEIATASDTTNYSSTTPFAHIGNSDHTTYSHYWNGYVSDARFISGTAVYSGNFTPPSGPLTTTGGTYPSTTNVDTSITASNTKLLLSGTDAHVIDKSQVSNLKLVGNAVAVTSASSPTPPNNTNISLQNSVFLDGSGDCVSITSGYDDPIFNFGTVDWTIELWAYIKTLSGGRNLFSFLRAGLNEAVPHLYTSDTSLKYYVSGSDRISSATNALTLNTWHHVALSRNGNDHKLYVDGYQVGSTWTSAQTYVQGRPVLGDYHSSLNTLTNGTNTLHGYAQDFRITKGLARYTAADESSNIPSAPLKG